MKAFRAFLVSLGPWGMLVVALIDGIGVPNPGGPDILLTGLSIVQPEVAYFAAALTSAGSLLGSFVLFWLARKGGEKYLDRRLRGERALRLREWFRHYGLVTVFIPALVPFPMPLKAFILCAGASGVGFTPFLLTLAAGRIPRYFGLAWLGRNLGENSTQWLSEHRWHFAAAAATLFVFCYLLIKVVDRMRHAKPESDPA